VILETNGRRWHDDPADFERDQEQWSVPARHGFRLVFATWAPDPPPGPLDLRAANRTDQRGVIVTNRPRRGCCPDVSEKSVARAQGRHAA
jgi:hypothetical protein